jgi:hypothetical protein
LLQPFGEVAVSGSNEPASLFDRSIGNGNRVLADSSSAPQCPAYVVRHGQRDEERRKVMSSLDIQRWSNDFTALTKVISEGIEQFVLRFISS